MYRPCRRSHSHRLVYLYWPRVILMGGLLMLLSLTKLSFSLLGFSFDDLFLLRRMLSMRLHQLSFSCLPLMKLSLSVHVRLAHRWTMGLLEGLRDSRQ